MNTKYTPRAGNAKESTSELLFYGTLLFFFFEYCRPGSYIPVLNYFNTLIPVSIFFLTLMSGSGPNNTDILKAKNTKWLAFFLFLIVISAVTADVKTFVLNKFLAVLGYVMMYYIVVRNVNSLKRVRILFAVLAGIHILLIVLNPLVILEPEKRHYIQGVTFLGDGNDFSLSVCLLLPFALFLFQTIRNRPLKYAALLTTGILLFAVVGMQSRGGFLALAATFFYYVLQGEKKLKIIIFSVIIACIMASLAPPEFYDRMYTIKDYKTEGSAQGRILAWGAAVRMAADHPFTGVGAGHFPVKYGIEYRPPGVGRTDIPWVTAHSLYFLGLGEFGLPGIVFIIGILSSNMLRIRRSLRDLKNDKSPQVDLCRKLSISMNCSIIAFATGSAFLSSLYYPHLYLLAALSECILIISKGVVAGQNHNILRLNDLPGKPRSGNGNAHSPGRPPESKYYSGIR